MGTFKAEVLLVQNIRALLAARGVDARSMAFAVGHSQAWISKILSGDRQMRLSDMDAIADFFGLTVAQLLQPGISAVTERRRRERRTGDRRGGNDRRRATNAERATGASTNPPRRSQYSRENGPADDRRLRLQMVE